MPIFLWKCINCVADEQITDCARLHSSPRRIHSPTQTPGGRRAAGRSLGPRRFSASPAERSPGGSSPSPAPRHRPPGVSTLCLTSGSAKKIIKQRNQRIPEAKQPERRTAFVKQEARDAGSGTLPEL